MGARSSAVCCAALASLFLANLVDVIDARKISLSVTEDDRSSFLVEPFCFDDSGQIDLKIRGFVQRLGSRDLVPPTGVGFLIRKTDNPQAAFNPAITSDFMSDQCILSKEYLLVGDVRVMMAQPDLNFTLSLKSQGAGLYVVLYANCAAGTTTSFDLSVAMTNDGGQMLSAGAIPLPLCLAGFTLAFTVALVVWVAVIIRNRESAHLIHHLMAVLCFIKLVSTALEAIRFQVIKETGDGGGWTHASYVFALIKGVMFFAVVLLVGTGWSFVKPFLSSRDKRILMVVVPLQVVVNIAAIVVEEMSPGTNGWLTWRDILHLFDILCCCAILFPIVWSIRTLREAALANDKAARSLKKLKLFREFYIMVVAYIYFTRIAVYLVQTTLPCGYSYIAESLSEGATLLFFVLSGYKFRPMPRNPYLQVDELDGEAEPDTYDAEMVPPAQPAHPAQPAQQPGPPPPRGDL